MNIANYIIKNFMKMIVLILLVCVVTFILAVNSPIDPIRQYIGTGTVGDEQRAAIEEYWGLNDSNVERFAKWFTNILQGDFGESVMFRRSVLSVIFERSGNSLFLMLSTFIMTGIAGYFLGLIMGRFRGSLADRAIKSTCIVFSATPTFWVGMLILIIFSVKLNLFPIGFSIPIGVLIEDVSIFDRIYHAILPIVTLTLVFIPNVALHTRSKVIEVQESDYVLFSKARGNSDRFIMKYHIIRNTLLPAVTIQFASFSEIFGGSVLAENVFSYPGLGSTIVTAGLGGDIPLLLGITIFISIFVFMGNFIADVLHAVINPMIREEGIL